MAATQCHKALGHSVYYDLSSKHSYNMIVGNSYT